MKFIFGFFIICIPTFCQTNNSLQADRPDQTETPAIVPIGMFQVESGFTFQKNNDNSYSNSLPSTLWKYGVNENFELRLITEFENENSDNKTIYGLKPILLGCKIKISDEKGIIPKTSFIGHIVVPMLASPDYKADFFAPEFRFTMQHSISQKISLGYNLGAEWDGFSPEATFIYTFTTGFVITKKIGFYSELFGFAPQNQIAHHSIDGGFTYLVNSNLMIDASIAFGLTENAPKNYLALGFSFRI